MKKNVFVLLCVASYSIFIWGCKPDDKEEDPIVRRSITMEFEGYFGEDVLTFNEMKWVTEASDTLNFTRISFLMSQFEIQKSSGEWVSLPDTNAFIRLDTRRNILKLTGDIPEGNYKALRFTIGLDSADNFGDPSRFNSTHPLNPLLNQMFWDWAGGYIFMVAEGYYMKESNSNAIFSYHMATMPFVKQIKVDVPNGFSTAMDLQLRLKVDMRKYFSTPNVFSIKEEGSASHSISNSDILIMNKLSKNLEGIFTLLD